MGAVQLDRLICLLIDPEYLIDVEGRFYRFDWNEYCGPTVLNKDGNARKKPLAEGHPFWDSLSRWIAGGEQVTADGVCVLLPKELLPPPPEKLSLNLDVDPDLYKREAMAKLDMRLSLNCGGTAARSRDGGEIRCTQSIEVPLSAFADLNAWTGAVSRQGWFATTVTPPGHGHVTFGTLCADCAPRVLDPALIAEMRRRRSS